MVDTAFSLVYDDKTDTYRSVQHDFTVGGEVIRALMNETSKRNAKTQVEAFAVAMKAHQVTQDQLSAYAEEMRRQRAEERAKRGTTGPPPVTQSYTGVDSEGVPWQQPSTGTIGSTGPAQPEGYTGVTASSWDSSLDLRSTDEIRWDEVVKTWLTCKQANYDPEEIGDILYTLLEEMIDGKVPE